jgi:phenylacetate-CoA ligase
LYFGCNYSPPKKLINKIKIYLNDKFVLNKHSVDFTTITDEKIRLAIDKINKDKPSSLWGYPSIMYEIAQYIIKNNIEVDSKNLKMIVISGESHTDHLKAIIQKAFNICPIDEYNSNEGFIAGSCKFGSLHLMEDTLIAEVKKADGTIAEYGYGELLVTYLYSYDFPLIRYKIGDIVNITETKCKCGRPFKVIDKVDGRKGSVIFNGDDKISNATCNHYVTKSSFMNSIFKYQISQNEVSSVVVKIIVSDSSRDFSEFEQIMNGLFDKIDVEFKYVDNIPRQKSGKHLDVINNIK